MHKVKRINRKICFALLSITVSVLFGACSSTKESISNAPLTIQEQGSFAVGGTKISEPGSFDLNNALKSQGQTFHGDHAYVFYQIPVKARKYILVFLHGAGQSKKHGKQLLMGEKVFRIFF